MREFGFMAAMEKSPAGTSMSSSHFAKGITMPDNLEKMTESELKAWVQKLPDNAPEQAARAIAKVVEQRLASAFSRQAAMMGSPIAGGSSPGGGGPGPGEVYGCCYYRVNGQGVASVMTAAQCNAVNGNWQPSICYTRPPDIVDLPWMDPLSQSNPQAPTGTPAAPTR
jgi:hypothetical protein